MVQAKNCILQALVTLKIHDCKAYMLAFFP